MQFIIQEKCAFELQQDRTPFNRLKYSMKKCEKNDPKRSFCLSGQGAVCYNRRSGGA